MTRSHLLVAAVTALVTTAAGVLLTDSAATAQAPTLELPGQPQSGGIQSGVVQPGVNPLTTFSSLYATPLQSAVGRDVVIEMKDDKQVRGQLIGSSVASLTVRAPSPSGFARTAFPDSATGGKPVEVWVPMTEVRYVIMRSPGAR